MFRVQGSGWFRGAAFKVVAVLGCSAEITVEGLLDSRRSRWRRRGPTTRPTPSLRARTPVFRFEGLLESGSRVFGVRC